MPIKNKDGTPYTIRGPNPLMKDQHRWDANNLVFHNLKFGGTVLADDTILSPFQSDLVVPDRPEPPAQPPRNETPPPEPVIPPQVVEEPNKAAVQTTTFQCHPAVITDRRDPIYGEVQRVVKKGNPFSFEGVVLKNDFVSFAFWTNVRRKDGTAVVTEGSVVFPQNADRQWWQVVKITPKTGGWVYECVMSGETPDFASVARP